MSKNKVPKPRNILLDQPVFLQRLYREWDSLSVNIETNIKFTKSKVYKKLSFRKKFCIKMQILFMKHYFKWLDRRIVLEVTEKQKDDKNISKTT